jgi:polyphosphate glucokinase
MVEAISTALSGGTLCIDIGGTGLKALVVDPSGRPLNERQRIPTPRPATPDAVIGGIKTLLRDQPAYERVSIGFPGVVVDGIVHTAPNLDGKWKGFKLAEEVQRLTTRPSRAANDADVAGYGVIQGRGVELVLTLGTGMGSALFVDGRLVPNLELAHHPLRKGRTYEEYVCDRELKRVGKKVWRKRVERVIDQIEPIWNYSMLYLGGGNSRHLDKDELPKNVKVVDNVAGLIGGLRLWQRP